jgi:hypothetical protein
MPLLPNILSWWFHWYFSLLLVSRDNWSKTDALDTGGCVVGRQKERVKSLEERMKDPRDLFMGVVLLTIAVLSWSRLFGWSLVIPGAVFIVGMVFWFAITLCQKSRLNRKAT